MLAKDTKEFLKVGPSEETKVAIMKNRLFLNLWPCCACCAGSKAPLDVQSEISELINRKDAWPVQVSFRQCRTFYRINLLLDQRMTSLINSWLTLRARFNETCLGLSFGNYLTFISLFFTLMVMADKCRLENGTCCEFGKFRAFKLQGVFFPDYFYLNNIKTFTLDHLARLLQ